MISGSLSAAVVRMEVPVPPRVTWKVKSSLGGAFVSAPYQLVAFSPTPSDLDAVYERENRGLSPERGGRGLSSGL